MDINSDYHVWLDAQTNAGQTVITAYVKSREVGQIGYQINLKSTSGTNTSNIKRNGSVAIEPNANVSLGKISLNLKPTDQCSLLIELSKKEQVIGRYSFKCPYQN